MSDIQSIITEAFERRASITPRSVETHVKEAVHEAINLLDSGKARVAEKKDSPELCFVTSGKHDEFVRSRRGDIDMSGEIVTTAGRPSGTAAMARLMAMMKTSVISCAYSWM